MSGINNHFLLVLQVLISPTINSHIPIQPTSSQVGIWEYRRSDSPFHHTRAVLMRNSRGYALRSTLHNVACHLQWTLMLIYWLVGIGWLLKCCPITSSWTHNWPGQLANSGPPFLWPGNRRVSFFVSFVPVSTNFFSWLIFIWSAGSLLTRRNRSGLGLPDTNDSK